MKQEHRYSLSYTAMNDEKAQAVKTDRGQWQKIYLIILIS